MRDQADNLNLCARAQDLVAYLYGEASAAEASDFESHTAHCASCAAELEALGHVRASIVEWRTQTLAGLASTAPATSIAPVLENNAASKTRGRSALAALREFFALSPMWLRGATALASLAICALVVFAAVRLLEGPRVLVVEKVVRESPSQADVNALVDKRVREELARRNQREDAPTQAVVTTASDQKVSVLARSTTSNPSSASRRDSTQRRSLARASRQESEQIARDLQLIPTRDEEELPRLIDLMDEAN
jgi:anti-sigma factor RsiW